MTNWRSADDLLFTHRRRNYCKCPTYGSIDHTTFTRAYLHLRVILITREREILIWVHSIHSFSNKFPNVFSVKYFPTVTIDFNSVTLFKPQSYNDT